MKNYLKIISERVRNFKLRNFKVLGIILLYSLLVIGGTYAYFAFQVEKTFSIGQGQCNLVNYTATEIDTSDLVSTTDYSEGAMTTITLSKNEECDIYNLVHFYVHTDEETTAPIDTVDALKYIVIANDDVVAEGVINQFGDQLIATVPLLMLEIDYDIYLWVDSSVSNGSYNQTTYSGYIYATSVQTSTVVDRSDMVNITYDYNTMLDDIFEDVYDTTTFYPCCGTGSITNTTTEMTEEGKIFSVTTVNQSWYFSKKNNIGLTTGLEYTYTFSAKASVATSLTIGSEQQGRMIVQIGTDWQNYSHTFTAEDSTYDTDSKKYVAFLFYNWYGEEERTLQIKNLQIGRENVRSATLSKKKEIL